MTVSRRRWPRWVLLALVVLPVIEVAVLIAIGRSIGWWPTVLALIVIALAGGWLLRREGPRAWRSLADAVSGVEVVEGVSVQQASPAPLKELSDGALVLLGGALLLLPGFVTDLLAIVCLLPATRPLPRRLFTEWVRGRAQRVMRNAGRPVITQEVFDAATEPKLRTNPDHPARPPATDNQAIIPGRIIEPPRP